MNERPIESSRTLICMLLMGMLVCWIRQPAPAAAADGAKSTSLYDRIIAASKRTATVFPRRTRSNDKKVADLALEGVLLFNRREPIKIGRRNIDWTGGHKAHQEWPAQLNRFPQLQSLRAMYVKTRDERYAACARDYIEDWIDQHKYTPQTKRLPGDSTLNMSIRLGGIRKPGWLAIVPDMKGSKAFDEQFIEKIVDSIDNQLEWLHRHIPARGNWRVSVLDCLVAHALRVPGRFDEYLAPAVRALNAEFRWQILPDGTHIERCAGSYHVWMCGVFMDFWRLAKSQPELGFVLDDRRVARMHSYTLHATKPNGDFCAFNDVASHFGHSPGGSARLLALLKKQKQIQNSIGMDEEVSRLGLFRAAGHVFYRTGWGADDTWWAFDAAGYGGAHSHLSRLSIEIHNGRRTTVPDPTSLDYEMSNPLAAAGKGTPMHSTMNLNLYNQSNADARLVLAEELPSAIVLHGRFEGSYFPKPLKWGYTEGHGKGVFGKHDRTVIWLKDRAMLVVDRLEHDRIVPAYLHWVSDDVPYEADPANLRFHTKHESGNVLIQVLPIQPSEVKMSVHKGEKDPYLGYVAQGRKAYPAPLFQFAFPPKQTGWAMTRTECVSVVVPFTGRSVPKFTADFKVLGNSREITVRWADGEVDRVVYRPGLAAPIFQAGDVRSDAALVLIRKLPGEDRPRVEQLRGSYAEVGE